MVILSYKVHLILIIKTHKLSHKSYLIIYKEKKWNHTYMLITSLLKICTFKEYDHYLITEQYLFPLKNTPHSVCNLRHFVFIFYFYIILYYYIIEEELIYKFLIISTVQPSASVI